MLLKFFICTILLNFEKYDWPDYIKGYIIISLLGEKIKSKNFTQIPRGWIILALDKCVTASMLLKCSHSSRHITFVKKSL
jgi:hypothetical protein